MNPHYTLMNATFSPGTETVIFASRLDLDPHFYYKYAP